MSYLQRVKPGDRHIDARTFNSLIDGRLEQLRGRTRDLPPPKAAPFFEIPLYNDSGANCDQFHILGLANDALILPSNNLPEFKSRLALKGTTPANPDHRGRFAVCLAPIAAGAIGRAAIAGLLPVQVNVVDTDDEFADIKASDRTQLQSGPFGARLLYKPASTGTQWCYVFIGPKPASGGVAFTDGSGITARSGSTPGSGTVTLYKRNSSGALTSRGYTATCYNAVDVAVGASRYIQYKIDDQGDLWVDVENCPA